MTLLLTKMFFSLNYDAVNLILKTYFVENLKIYQIEENKNSPSK